MTTFNEREKAFEKKYEHDQDLKFKVNARKNKLLGLWAAGLMGKSGADAEAYAKEVVLADFEKPGDSDVIDKLVKDLAAAGKPMEDHTIRKQAERLAAEAKAQFMKETRVASRTPHPEEPRMARRLEGWATARLVPPFETRPSGAPQGEAFVSLPGA